VGFLQTLIIFEGGSCCCFFVENYLVAVEKLMKLHVRLNDINPFKLVLDVRRRLLLAIADDVDVVDDDGHAKTRRLAQHTHTHLGSLNMVRLASTEKNTVAILRLLN